MLKELTAAGALMAGIAGAFLVGLGVASNDDEPAPAPASAAETCDPEKATEIFNDLMSSQASFLDQYEEYLRNDEVIFALDLDSVDAASTGDYTAGEPMTEQFEQALEGCKAD